MSKDSGVRPEVVIMAGGQGTRFWPISRKANPKQFLSVNKSGESLIQATARRVQPLLQGAPVKVITNSQHAELVKQHVSNCELIIEPAARNTAAAIGLAAIKIRQHRKDDPVLIILPADHAVTDEVALCKTLEQAARTAAATDCLVTIGLKPLSPHTGYGYIRRGNSSGPEAFKVVRFYEKPNLDRAMKYLESGDYFWNSGMFAWRASSILEAIAVYMPTLAKGLTAVEKALGSDREQQVVTEVFADLESISIDFGVLEHATNCQVVIAGDIGWSDVGSWDAWSEHFQKDSNGNMVRGEALLIDSKNCVVYSKQSQIAVLGASDLIVIDAGDAILVCPREHVQDVKKIVVELQKQGRTDLI